MRTFQNKTEYFYCSIHQNSTITKGRISNDSLIFKNEDLNYQITFESMKNLKLGFWDEILGKEDLEKLERIEI